MKTRNVTTLALLVGSLIAAPAFNAYAGKFASTGGPPTQGQLGNVVINPYDIAPLAAVIDLGGKRLLDAKVTVRGKGKDGRAISYDVERKNILTHNGIPVFGLYANHMNVVDVTYTLEESGKQVSETYKVQTQPIFTKALDGMQRPYPEMEVKTVKKGFEDRLYLVNASHRGTESKSMTWALGGAANWNSFPSYNFVTDTQGEVRWYLNSLMFNGDEKLAHRGVLMGWHQMENGDMIIAKGQSYMRYDLLGRKVFERRLPRGYIDQSHEIIRTERDTYMIRVAKKNYVRPDGKLVNTVRDHIIEVDEYGKLVEEWDLNMILDPTRSSLITVLDSSAVCLNIDMDKMGQKVELEPDAPFGDEIGIGTGRNWAHVNSIAYDASDDSIILSLRHQGTVKIGRDKEVKWILSAPEGWRNGFEDKVLTPVDSKGRKLNCEAGVCEDTDFDWSWTQHTAWLSGRGTLTVFDNGDGRGLDQPAMPSMKYSRGVEYKINEKDMTVEQVWEYGKERGYEWYSAVTSSIKYHADTETMVMFSGSAGLFNRPEVSTPWITEVSAGQDKDVKVEMKMWHVSPSMAAYRALVIDPDKAF
ncbi:aryl-sulfate sulfotransferase [Ferrimonas lipolytica]|uniref:Aryl-sulfate sulfotransferase n=1 Tax=Ferrimonas lipolytica TaxID=2724191 RepID=A0A6H1UGX3_9GAMM|nr:aryl-sulfate sulfotransferase [Ferrimonas lipolytica]QIZ77042.1 aryl-sulfate sulfotransferase [Ferrimonas lipolytica]